MNLERFEIFMIGSMFGAFAHFGLTLLFEAARR